MTRFELDSRSDTCARFTATSVTAVSNDCNCRRYACLHQFRYCGDEQ
jgi:hypothetical protein